MGTKFCSEEYIYLNPVKIAILKCFVQNFSSFLCGKKLKSFRVNDFKRIISLVVYNLFQVIDMKTLYFHVNLLMYKILL